MDRNLWERLQPLMDRALELEPGERTTWLNALRTESPTIARELQQLLHHEGTLDRRGFLDASPLLDTSAIRELTAAPTFDLDRITAALAGRYTLERQIGEGGMAKVFLARDERHERPVAVKIIRPDATSVLGAKRFLAEIRLTANLTHPNILPLLDSGEAAGTLYYVMPYIDGESLRARMRRDGQLPVEEAVRIARMVAEALAHAHEKGTVHRDIKPDNVLLSGRQAWVADFGIAKAMSQSTTHTGTGLGVALGTPAYMAPEQIEGAESVDARADLYSWGAMLWEMLAGRTVFEGASVQHLLLQHMTVEAPSVATIRQNVPAPLATLLARCLEKDPVNRPQSALELLTALDTTPEQPRPSRSRSPLLIGGLLVAIVATGSWLALRGDSGLPSPIQLTETGDLLGGAISPDGTQLAFRRRGQNPADIWLRPAQDSGSARVIARAMPGPLFWVDNKTIAIRVPGPAPALATVQVPDGSIEHPEWSRGLRVAALASGEVYALFDEPTGVAPIVMRRITSTGPGDSVSFARDSGERLTQAWIRGSSTDLIVLSTTRDSVFRVGVLPPGGKRRLVASIPVNEPGVRTAFRGLGFPSPDGRYLFFRKSADSVFRIPLDGSERALEVAHLPTPGDIINFNTRGDLLFATRDRIGKTWRFSLAQADLPGTVVDQSRGDLRTALSPDGSLIIEARFDNDSSALQLRRLDGGAARHLITVPGRVWYLLWSPDGAHVALRTAQPGRTQEWGVLDTRDGSLIRIGPAPRGVASNAIDAGFPALWSADGTTLFAQPFYEDYADYVVRQYRLVNGDTGTVFHLASRRLSSGEIDSLGVNGLAMSPDGQQVVVGGLVLEIVSIATKRARRLIDFDTAAADWILPLKWSEKTGEIIFARRVAERGPVGNVFSLYAIPSTGGAPRTVGAIPDAQCGSYNLLRGSDEASCFSQEARSDLWLSKGSR